MLKKTRFVSVCVLVAGVMATAGRARAETGTLPNAAQITWERFFIADGGGDFVEPATPDDRRQYLNFAHCACSKAGLGTETAFQYEVKLSTTTGTGKPGSVWVGTQCDNDQVRPMMCRNIAAQDIGDIDSLAVTTDRIEVSLYDAINGFDDTGECAAREGDAFVWILVDHDGDNVIDYTTNQSVGANADVMGVDTQPPPLPTKFNAESGEGAIEISWTVPTSRATDIYAYQALCMDENDEPAVTDKPAALYQTTTTLCNLPQDFALTESVIDNSDGTAVLEAPEPFRALDQDFLCGEQSSGTATSLTISGLKNDKPYRVALLVVDYYGNVVGTYFNQTITPKPVTDFWEDLHDRNSAVKGGCLLSQTYGEASPLTQVLRSFRDTTLARTALGRSLTRAYYATIGKLDVEGSLALRVIAGLLLLPLVVIALLWHALTLPGLLALIALLVVWRRNRHRLRFGARLRLRRAVMPAAILACLVVPRLAAADDYTPYWETDEQSDSTLLDFPEVKWHAGIRVGPYIPEIDLQAGLNALTGKGPYEAMFGTYYLADSSGVLKKHERSVWQVLPMLDVDRVIWDGFGQVAVGGSLGYMQKSAYAYLDGTSEDDLMRPRSRASRNTFKLIPLAATVTYRFTLLDDLYGIPVVPYVKGGLSYYMWWVKAPNGDVSKACDERDVNMECIHEDKAYGGSLGFQGSVGLAVRAERIDADAAMSMRTSGIQHAGFYAELQYAKVDGFGSESKLSVGDNTWFAGVDFEF